MFVRDFVHVGHPFEVVAPRFVRDTTWLSPIATEAAMAAREVARRLAPRITPSGPQGPARGADPDIRCEVGPVRAYDGGILVPMWLISTGRVPALPDLSGDLEVAPVGADRSLIALDATYRRTTLERDRIHQVERATEAGVRTFLAGIAAYFDGPASAW